MKTPIRFRNIAHHQQGWLRLIQFQNYNCNSILCSIPELELAVEIGGIENGIGIEITGNWLKKYGITPNPDHL